MATEQTFFQHNDTLITSNRFVVGSHTYAIGQITSFQTREIPPNRQAPGLLLLLGVLIFIWGISTSILTAIVGALILAGCGFWLYRQKQTYAIILISSASEIRAVTSPEKSHIDKLSTALGQAISNR